MVQKFVLSWIDIHNIVVDLNFKTLNNDGKNIGIIGISRGGLVPAVMLSHLKNSTFFATVGINSYHNKIRGTENIYQVFDTNLLHKLDTVYLIDDICDTGKTFSYLKNNMFNMNNIKTISLIYKKNNVFKPDYYGYEVESEIWVDFPFEMG